MEKLVLRYYGNDSNLRGNYSDYTMITKILPPVIWYTYKGDEICWTGTGYTSLTCGGNFPTLEAMDEFWEGYNDAFMLTYP